MGEWRWGLEKRGSPNFNGSQFTVQETLGTSGYLLFLALYSLSFSPSLSPFFYFSFSLIMLHNPQRTWRFGWAPMSNMKHVAEVILMSGWGLVPLWLCSWSLPNILICLFVCNCVSINACVLNTDTCLPLLLGNSFWALTGEECHHGPTFAHTNKHKDFNRVLQAQLSGQPC